MQDKKGSHNSGVDSRESELVDGSGDASAESTPAEIPESVQGGAEGGSVPLDQLDPATLEMIHAVNQFMPFGKFKGQLLIDLPEPYIVWFKQRGFPNGKLGRQMALVYEIKLNGLEKVFRPLVRQPRPTDADSSAS